MNPADSVQTDEDTAYDDLVDYLAPALVGQESAGKTNAVSEENAYMKAKKTGTAKGLWQLLDATGKEWHDRLGIEEPYDPFNAKQNEAIGRAYLKHLLKLFSGDMELALTAYHSGEGTVQGLLKKHKASSLSEIRKYLGPKGQKYAAQVLGRLRGGEVET